MTKNKKIPSGQKTVLKNGLRILTEKIPTMRSVALGIMVGAGSGTEEEKNLGISHFIEHMTFKGTSKRSSFQIAKDLDAVGGKINAYTGKEYTVYLSVILDEYIDVALDVLSDIFLNSLYDKNEIELEKGVILEEIKMYEDAPDELIHDIFSELIMGDHPMGKSTLGKVETVKNLKREDILAFRKSEYSADNTIISVAGNINHTDIVKKIEEYFKALGGKIKKREEKLPVIKPHIKFISKKTQQAHMCLGTKGISILDKRRFAFAALDSILGGSMSSRLFQEIREKRGLAYSIFSANESFKNFGVFSVCAGIDKKNLTKVTELILKELRSLKKEGVSKDELKRAKDYLKGSLVLGLESTASRMSWLARSEFYYGKTLTIDEIFRRIDKISQDDIIEFSNECFQDNYMNLAVIGDFKEDESPIKDLKC